MKAQHLVMSLFFLQPLAFGAWLPRIPEIQSRLELGPSELALALLGMPVGLLLIMPFAGSIVTVLGGRTTILWSLPAFLVAMCLPPTATHVVALFAALLACGMTMALVELGMNIVADEIERRDTVAIMSRCHGFWSLGMMSGSLLGSWLALMGLMPQIGVLVVAVLVLPFAALVVPALPVVTMAMRMQAKGGGSSFFLPGLLLVSICIVGLASNLAEGASADWSAVYLTSVFSAAAGEAGLGYAAYAFTMAVGRFAGDWLRIRLGPVLLVRCCYMIAAIGVALLSITPHYLVSILAFALIGLGGSVGVPIAVSAAASAGGRSAAANVAMVTMVSLIAFLAGPPLIGYLAEHFGLRTALGIVLIPPFVAGVLLAPSLDRAGRTR